MAFFNDLVRVIAEVEGMDPMTVRGIGLNVREGGHITKGGRGLSAANMTTRDAANLLIGVNATMNSKTAGDAILKYRMLRLTDRVHLRDDESGLIFAAPPLREEFGTHLELLIDAYRDGGDIRRIVLKEDRRSECLAIGVSFGKPEPYAEVNYSIKDSNVAYASLWFMGFGNYSDADRKDTTTISDRSLRAIAQALDS